MLLRSIRREGASRGRKEAPPALPSERREDPQAYTVEWAAQKLQAFLFDEHYQPLLAASSLAKDKWPFFELCTPLNAILGFAQLLQRDKKEPLSSRHRDRVDQILKGGDHLLHLINDILDLARIEAGGVSISIEPVSVPEVLDEVKKTPEPMAAREGIVIGVELPLDEPILVTADRTRFSQILMNLGSNAIKYNRAAGSATFIVSQPRPTHVRVAVRDTGVGIPTDRQDKVFQPFQRAGQEVGPIEGTGIGLLISRRLARLMGGELGFRSVEGDGSEFWVDIPSHARDREDRPRIETDESSA